MHRLSAASYFELVWNVIGSGSLFKPVQNRLGDDDTPAVCVADGYGWPFSHFDGRILLSIRDGRPLC